MVLSKFKFAVFMALSRFTASPYSWGSRGSWSSRILLGRLRRFLFFLAGAGFLSILLTACAGGGGSSSGGSDGNGGNVPLSPLEVNLTFAPMPGGFQIGNQSDFGDMVSLNITATSEGRSPVETNISTAEFVDDSYDFTGLNDQSDWEFQIIGTLSDGRQQEVTIVFTWQENEEEHNNDGIRPGMDTDGDRRADSVDNDIDGDGVANGEDQCRVPGGETNWQSNDSTDKDRDGCQDASEDIDDDGDGLIEIATPAQLDEVRYALNGNGSRSAANAALDTSGCGGGQDADGMDITSCSGYELVANISLAAYSGGDGWQPLGHDTDDVTAGCQGTTFSGTFEGNGFMISNLSISRSGEDCVGLFGNIAANTTIRNLRLSAEGVIGKNRVGSLVGNGESARIYSSSVVAAEVSGAGTNVGGLMGSGDSAWIVSSSVVASEVSGGGSMGGLVGNGDSAWIVSSSVVVGELSGVGQNIGGLVGVGRFTRIVSSSIVMGEISGSGIVGGLVGNSESAWIVSSSVVVGQASGGFDLGGLTGFFADGKVAYSYVVSGKTSADMLVGGGSQIEAVASYWDNTTSGVESGNLGSRQKTSDLQMPTGYTDIYVDWDKETITFSDGAVDEPLAVWCDEDNSGEIELDEETPDNLIWNFGTSSQYPAIRCTPLDPDEWRSWWFLNGAGEPQLNQTRLDMYFP